MRELMEDYGLAIFYSIMGMAGVLGFVYLILEVSVCKRYWKNTVERLWVTLQESCCFLCASFSCKGLSARPWQAI